MNTAQINKLVSQGQIGKENVKQSVCALISFPVLSVYERHVLVWKTYVVYRH